MASVTSTASTHGSTVSAPGLSATLNTMNGSATPNRPLERNALTKRASSLACDLPRRTRSWAMPDSPPFSVQDIQKSASLMPCCPGAARADRARPATSPRHTLAEHMHSAMTELLATTSA